MACALRFKGVGAQEPLNEEGVKLRAEKQLGFRRAKQKLAAGGEIQMLWTIFVILLILWLLGIVSSYTLGGFIHILLVVALVMLIINLLSGRRLSV
jgi:hypothetical protein